MVSSTVGSSTNTCWKRLSSAASFSMYFLYSSSVVAPMQWSSPLASAGLSILEASTAPSEAPAPTTVCISSMNSIMSPLASVTSLSTALSLSSNCPLYLAPARSDPMSSDMSFLFLRPSGTSPFTILCARPSTMAVLPTPGSPMSTGLFFVLLESTCMTRLISSSRPMTGSIFPSRASSVKSLPYCFNDWRVSSGDWLVTVWPPRMSLKVRSMLSLVILSLLNSFLSSPVASSTIPRRRCSVLMYSSPKDLASFSAVLKALLSSRLI